MAAEGEDTLGLEKPDFNGRNLRKASGLVLFCVSAWLDSDLDLVIFGSLLLHLALFCFTATLGGWLFFPQSAYLFALVFFFFFYPFWVIGITGRGSGDRSMGGRLGQCPNLILLHTFVSTFARRTPRQLRRGFCDEQARDADSIHKPRAGFFFTARLSSTPVFYSPIALSQCLDYTHVAHVCLSLRGGPSADYRLIDGHSVKRLRWPSAARREPNRGPQNLRAKRQTPGGRHVSRRWKTTSLTQSGR